MGISIPDKSPPPYTPLLSSQASPEKPQYHYSTYNNQKYYTTSNNDDSWVHRRKKDLEYEATHVKCLTAFLAVSLFIFFGMSVMTLSGTGPWGAPAPGVTRRVAIIGAGASGASAAYHLAKYGPGGSSADSLEITVFEKSPTVGGRCMVLDVPKAGGMRASSFKVDLGAPGYNTALDELVSSLVQEVGLQYQTVPGGRWAPVTADWDLGIFNGHTLLFRQPHNAQGIWYWWTNLGYFIRYGWAHNNLESITKRLIPIWKTYTQGLSFPLSWMNTPQAQTPDDLRIATTTPAVSYLDPRNVKHPFTTEQIQSRTRARYGSNLGVLSGMQAMRVMKEAENEMTTNVVLEGGMAALFSKMLDTNKHARNTRLNVKLGTMVGGVRKNETEHGETLGWTVAHWSTPKTNEVPSEPIVTMEDFDEVVIAGPWHLTGLNMQPEYPPQELSWEKVHVTVFTSTHKLAPGSFGIGEDDFIGMPQRILSTLDDSERDKLNEKSGGEGVGNVGWWSVEHIGVIPRIIAGASNEDCADPGMCAQSIRMENVFKILSPYEIADETILHMLGASDPQVLTWVRRHFWEHAYATPVPDEITDEDISNSLRVDEGLWYTVGVEGFWGGVEAAVTMGKRVADELVDKWSHKVPRRGTVRRGEGW